MVHLHRQFEIGPEDTVEVTLDGDANVMLLDSANYAHYRRGEPYRYYGGLADASPVYLSPPCEGVWHLVVDLGGYAGHVRTAVRILQGTEKVGA
jgi:hypothetical protein